MNNNLRKLTAEQRAALAKFAGDFQKAMPHMAAAAKTAQKVHQSMLDAPTWSLVENSKPTTPAEDPQMWTVGHAQVNYVDHIDTIGEK